MPSRRAVIAFVGILIGALLASAVHAFPLITVDEHKAQSDPVDDDITMCGSDEKA
ncbi:MAG: hypothetical protein ACKVQT_14240 [Burkholderiales bacterium]